MNLNSSFRFLPFLVIFLIPGCKTEICPLQKIDIAFGKIVEKDYAGAIATLDSVKEAHPECPELFYHLGTANQWMNNPGPCVDNFTTALSLSQDTCPQMVDAMVGRAWCRVMEKNYAEAAADYRAALVMGYTCTETKNTQASIRSSLANCYYLLGQYSDALDEIEVILTLEKDNYAIAVNRFLRAKVLNKLDRKAEMLPDLNFVDKTTNIGKLKNGDKIDEIYALFIAGYQARDMQDSVCYFYKIAKENARLYDWFALHWADGMQVDCIE